MTRNMNLDEKTCAYIAGYIDAKNIIFGQIVENPIYKFGFTVRVFIAFHQRNDKKWFLLKLKKLLNYGSIKTVQVRDKGNFVEYLISNIDIVENILTMLLPYTIAKKSVILNTLNIIRLKRATSSASDFLDLCRLIEDVPSSNELYNLGKPHINYEYVKLKLKDKFPLETLQ